MGTWGERSCRFVMWTENQERWERSHAHRLSWLVWKEGCFWPWNSLSLQSFLLTRAYNWKIAALLEDQAYRHLKTDSTVYAAQYHYPPEEILIFWGGPSTSLSARFEHWCSHIIEGGNITLSIMHILNNLLRPKAEPRMTTATTK
jgi:hypothetical protein